MRKSIFFNINILLLSMFGLFSMTSCNKPEPENGGDDPTSGGSVEFTLLSDGEMQFPCQGGSDTIFYELKNAAADGYLDISPKDGWVGSFDTSVEGQIVFTVNENTEAEERTCTLRVSYVYNQSNSLYFDVAVTQEGQTDVPDDPDDPDDPEDPTTPPAVGDFFYSDGTYSSDLDQSKTPIGIVFWTGDPGRDDAALRKDHPECTNGLVVALDGDEYSVWQTNHTAYGKTVSEWIEANATEYEPILTGPEPGDNLNRILGYNNTKAIEAFNAAPENSDWPVTAVEKAVAYNQTCPAPSNTSGWYLPSGKELKILCYKEVDDVYFGRPNGTDNKEYINGRLAMVDGAQQLGYADEIEFYRSSSEYDATRAWSVIFVYGDIGPNGKGFAQSSVRFVLAF